jgi:hypothetical protein
MKRRRWPRKSSASNPANGRNEDDERLGVDDHVPVEHRRVRRRSLSPPDPD